MQESQNRSEAVRDRELVITRVFDAPAHRVFDAHSKREHLMQWFGPRGWPLTLCEVDFRVGGRFRFAMTGPSGEQNTPFGGEYLEIVPNRKIVYDNGFESPGAKKMVVTVTLEELGGKTTLTLHTVFASVAMRNEHVNGGMEEGVASGHEQLDEVLANAAARSATKAG
jgi:uncharacterized protein YndB with AHSA1/START domain